MQAIPEMPLATPQARAAIRVTRATLEMLAMATKALVPPPPLLLPLLPPPPPPDQLLQMPLERPVLERQLLVLELVQEQATPVATLATPVLVAVDKADKVVKVAEEELVVPVVPVADLDEEEEDLLHATSLHNGLGLPAWRRLLIVDSMHGASSSG